MQTASDDVLMTPCGRPREVPQAARPRTRSVTRCGSKKPRNDGSTSHKRHATFKEPEVSPATKKQKSDDAVQADVSGSSQRTRRSGSGAGSKSTNAAPRWNFHCSLKTVYSMISGLTPQQKQEFVRDTMFESLLEIKIDDDVFPPSFLQWIYTNIDPDSMVLKVGPGKEILFDKDVVKLMFGFRSSGEGQFLDMEYKAKTDEAKELRNALRIKTATDLNLKSCLTRISTGGTDELTKRCFFLVLFNRFLFPSGSPHIANCDIERTRDLSAFNRIDWCHEIYIDIRNGVQSLHKKLHASQTAYTIPGCSILLGLYYLDCIHHREGPVDRFITPRIKVFHTKMITTLLAHDVVRDVHTIKGYGALDFRPASQMCYRVGHNTGSTYIPSLSKLLDRKLLELRGDTQCRFQALVADYDKEVQIQCENIDNAIKEIAMKQETMRQNFALMIDELIDNAAGGNDDDDADDGEPAETQGHHSDSHGTGCLGSHQGEDEITGMDASHGGEGCTGTDGSRVEEEANIGTDTTFEEEGTKAASNVGDMETDAPHAATNTDSHGTGCLGSHQGEDETAGMDASHGGGGVVIGTSNPICTGMDKSHGEEKPNTGTRHTVIDGDDEGVEWIYLTDSSQEGEVTEAGSHGTALDGDHEMENTNTSLQTGHAGEAARTGTTQHPSHPGASTIQDGPEMSTHGVENQHDETKIEAGNEMGHVKDGEEPPASSTAFCHLVNGQGYNSPIREEGASQHNAGLVNYDAAYKSTENVLNEYGEKPRDDKTPNPAVYDNSAPRGSHDEAGKQSDSSVPRAGTCSEKGEAAPVYALSDSQFQETSFARDNTLWELLTSSDLPFKNTIICQFRGDHSKAREVRYSFAIGQSATEQWLDYYIYCLVLDEAKRLQSRSQGRKRLYLDMAVWNAIYPVDKNGDPLIYSPIKLREVLRNYLPAASYLEGLDEILLPVFRKEHFSVYVINFVMRRIDILDPNPWHVIGKGWENTHMGDYEDWDKKGKWCKVMTKRLSDQLHVVRKAANLPRFGNWACKMVEDIPKQQVGSNDCAFFAMWYMDYYDALSGSVNWPYPLTSEEGVKSEVIRANTLQYIIFHAANEVVEHPPEIEQFRPPTGYMQRGAYCLVTNDDK